MYRASCSALQPAAAERRTLLGLRSCARAMRRLLTSECARPLGGRPAHKSFFTKKKLAKKQNQNRPIPQWIRMRTGNKIRCVDHPIQYVAVASAAAQRAAAPQAALVAQLAARSADAARRAEYFAVAPVWLGSLDSACALIKRHLSTLDNLLRAADRALFCPAGTT